MRISKAIREYVEEEIYKKYNDAAVEIGKEYYDEKKQAEEMVLEIMTEASKKAEEYLKDLGYMVMHSYRSDSIFSLNGSFSKPEENSINNKRNDMRAKARTKARQVLFDLEMGETTKQQLKEFLDNVVID